MPQDVFNDREVMTMLGVSILSFLFLAGIMIAVLLTFQKKKFMHLQKIKEMEIAFQQQLYKSQIEVHEHTLNTLGKDLHDNVGQLINSANVLMGILEKDAPHIKDKINLVRDTNVKALQELRNVSKSLDKDWLSNFSFIENIQQEANRINASGKTIISVDGSNALISIGAEKRVMLYRIVQEALQNAVKHSGASQINLQIENRDQVLCINISDNGTGFIEKNGKGMGLSNMKHRTALIGGTLQINSKPYAGTNIIITLPVDNMPA